MHWSWDVSRLSESVKKLSPAGGPSRLFYPFRKSRNIPRVHGSRNPARKTVRYSLALAVNAEICPTTCILATGNQVSVYSATFSNIATHKNQGLERALFKWLPRSLHVAYGTPDAQKRIMSRNMNAINLPVLSFHEVHRRLV